MNPIDRLNDWLGRPPHRATLSPAIQRAQTDHTMCRLRNTLAGAPSDSDRATTIATAARAMEYTAAISWPDTGGSWRQSQMLQALSEVHFGPTGLRVPTLAPFGDGTRLALRTMSNATEPAQRVKALAEVVNSLAIDDPARTAAAIVQTALTVAADTRGAWPSPCATPAQTTSAPAAQIANARHPQ